MLRRLARANDQDSGSHSFLLCSQFQTQAGAHTLLIIEWVTGCELFGSFTHTQLYFSPRKRVKLEKPCQSYQKICKTKRILEIVQDVKNKYFDPEEVLVGVIT